jgi:hypothetical protein
VGRTDDILDSVLEPIQKANCEQVADLRRQLAEEREAREKDEAELKIYKTAVIIGSNPIAESFWIDRVNRLEAELSAWKERWETGITSKVCYEITNPEYEFTPPLAYTSVCNLKGNPFGLVQGIVTKVRIVREDSP